MEKLPDPDFALIEELGGIAKVAKALGFKIQRVQNWKLRGIPSSMKLKRPDLFLPGMKARRKKPT